MNYKIKIIKNMFCLFEIPTNSIIHFSHDESVIKEMCKFLNAGGGFNGHTPVFLTRTP